MKTYIITLSKHFLKGHPKAGKPTYFADKLRKGLGGYDAELSDEWGVFANELPAKIHTIRGNYDLWAGRIKEVQDGEAMLSIRQWSGKPYRSPQQIIVNLTATHGVGVQKLTFDYCHIRVDGRVITNPFEIVGNDGLKLEDFQAWFKGYDRSQPMAVIHFTKFRY